MDELYYSLSKVPGVEAFPVNEPTLGADLAGQPISLVVQGPDYLRVAGYADAIVERGREIPGVINLRSQLKLNKPQLSVSIDRDRASDLGVSLRDVASTLQILLGGLELSTYKLHGETYKVIAQLERPERSNPKDLYGLRVRSITGELVPLDSVVSLEETLTAPGLFHHDRMRSATITGSLLSGVALGGALERLRGIAEETLPSGEGFHFTFSGDSERFFDSTNALLFAYGLAVLLVYLVLAAQFESFIHPATILVSVALSFPGALLALYLAGQTLNLFSMIGLVMLVGLVTKNSILIVEFANQRRSQGASPLEAVRSAARIRFRPVLMTALSTIAGILPIALGLGAGGEARAPLGVAVAGGMALATLFTFFVIPVVYMVFARLEDRYRLVSAPALADARG